MQSIRGPLPSSDNTHICCACIWEQCRLSRTIQGLQRSLERACNLRGPAGASQASNTTTTISSRRKLGNKLRARVYQNAVNRTLDNNRHGAACTCIAFYRKSDSASCTRRSTVADFDPTFGPQGMQGPEIPRTVQGWEPHFLLVSLALQHDGYCFHAKGEARSCSVKKLVQVLHLFFTVVVTLKY